MGMRSTVCREHGQSVVEFALVLPFVTTILLGIVVFGIAFNNSLALTNATNMGAQVLAISRGQTLDPCNATAQAVYQAAPNLVQKSLNFTITITPTSGTAVNIGGSSCSSTSYTTGAPSDLVSGSMATLKVTYPCNLVVYGKNLAPNCTLSAQTSEVIQ
jgi:Flp pilus assembly protein TadG